MIGWLALWGCVHPPDPLWLPLGDDGSALGRAPRVRWQREVGLTHYRAGVLAVDDLLLVPSNGRSWEGTSEDDQDGIWVLEARTGEVVRQIVPPGEGERDVNGIGLDGKDLLFGTDQGWLYRTRLDGEPVWAVDVSQGEASVEGGPVLADVDGDGALEVAVAVEFESLQLRDGATGALRWEVAGGAWAQPTASDLDGDGDVDWLFPVRRGNELRALTGAGEQLWRHEGPSTYFAPPLVLRMNGQPTVAAASRYNLVLSEPATGRVHLRWRNPDAETAIYGMGWFEDAGCVLLAHAPAAPGLICVDPRGVERWSVALLPTRVSASPVFGDVDGEPGEEAVIGTEAGDLWALDSQGRVVWHWKAAGPIECPVTLLDLDGNERTDVLVASQDGLLTALSTPGRAPDRPRYWRGDERNSGVSQ